MFKEMQNLGLRRRKEEDYFIDPPEGKLVFLQPVYYTQDTCSVHGAYVTIDEHTCFRHLDTWALF